MPQLENHAFPRRETHQRVLDALLEFAVPRAPFRVCRGRFFFGYPFRRSGCFFFRFPFCRSDRFFCSGALLRVETEHPEIPVNFGISDSPVVMFQAGPAFETLPGFKGAVLARYPKQTNPLESGLLLHPEAIEGKIAALELAYGHGRILLFGFKPQFRGEAHATYKYFFNELYSFDHPPLPAEPAPAAKAKAEATAAAARPNTGAKAPEPEDDDIEE